MKTFFFGLLILLKKWSSADVKTFFGLHLILLEKLHECDKGAVLSHIFRKGAIVQKRLKTPDLTGAILLLVMTILVCSCYL